MGNLRGVSDPHRLFLAALVLGALISALTSCRLEEVSLFRSQDAAPDAPFGVQMFNEDADDPRVRQLAARGSGRWVRIYVDWSSLEPENVSPADYNWSALDARLGKLVAAGLAPFVTVTNNPAWAASTSCGPVDRTDLGALGETMGALAERYDADGSQDAPGSPRVRYYEMYNEQDQISPENNAGGCWGNEPAAYARMLAVVWDAVHAADAQARVVLGGLAFENLPGYNFRSRSDNFLTDVLAYVAEHPDEYFDAVSLHRYDFLAGRWNGELPYNQGVMGKVSAVRELLFLHGLSDKEIVASEIGMQVGRSEAAADYQSLLETQARHLVREYTRALAGGLKVVIWYTMVDEGYSGLLYGLLEKDLEPRPAYRAFLTLNRELGSSSFETQLGPASTGSRYVQAFRFRRPGGEKTLVLFTDTGEPIKSQTHYVSAVSLGAPTFGMSAGEWTGRLRVVDKLGGFSKVRDGGSSDGDGEADGSVTLMVSQDPIYVSIGR